MIEFDFPTMFTICYSSIANNIKCLFDKKSAKSMLSFSQSEFSDEGGYCSMQLIYISGVNMGRAD